MGLVACSIGVCGLLYCFGHCSIASCNPFTEFAMVPLQTSKRRCYLKGNSGFAVRKVADITAVTMARGTVFAET
jgi:hypothetical protein